MADPNLPIHSTRLPQITPGSGLSVREDVAFSDAQGHERPRVRKAANQTFSRLQEILPRVLQSREVVLYALAAQAPISPLAQLFLGWQAYGFTRTILVLTNLRLLRFRIRSKGWNRWIWDQGVQSVALGDISESRVKGFLSPQLSLHYRDGRKERYWRLRMRDARKLKTILPPLLQNSTGTVSPAGGMIPLCPKCLATLSPNTYRCSQCGQVFKDEKTLRRFLLIPGGEYFYVGQNHIGVLHGLGQAMWLLVVVAVVAGLMLGPHRANVLNAVIPAGGVFGFFTLHKLAGFFPCRQLVREFIPLK
ncbi:MAG: hypothetical protein DMG31_05855 [Acidobacteria bacterium]|nr:MAG: hypothetical protein DMG31_05855 [Acidobacteriota bacterium]